MSASSGTRPGRKRPLRNASRSSLTGASPALVSTPLLKSQTQRRHNSVASRLKARLEAAQETSSRPVRWSKQRGRVEASAGKEKDADEEEQKLTYEVDNVGNNSSQVSSLLLKRPTEINPDREGELSARGMHHRNDDTFRAQILSASTLIRQAKKEEDTSGARGQSYLAQQYFSRAYAYERLNMVHQAIEDYTLCLKHNEECSQAYFNRSGLHYYLGDLDKAVADLDEAISIDGNNHEYFQNRCRLRMKQGHFIESTGDLINQKKLEEREQERLALAAGLTGQGQGQSEVAESEQIDSESSSESDSDADSDMDGEDPPGDAELLLRTTEQRERDRVEKEKEEHEAFLHKPPGERTRRELRLWKETILRVPYFAFLANHEDMVMKLADVIYCVKYPANMYIFRKGDPGYNFMVLYEGAVNITITIDVGSSSTDKVLKRLHKNDTFGETALLSAHGTRSAHAFVEQDSLLLVIDCEPFLEIQAQLNDYLRNEKLHTFRQCLAFRSWSEEKLSTLCDRVIVKLYESNQVVVEQGSDTDELYVLKHGVVKILKAVPPRLCQDFMSQNDTTLRTRPKSSGGVTGGRSTSASSLHSSQRGGRPATLPTLQAGRRMEADTSQTLLGRESRQGSRPATTMGLSRRHGRPARGQTRGPAEFQDPDNELSYQLKVPGLWVTQTSWKDQVHLQKSAAERAGNGGRSNQGTRLARQRSDRDQGQSHKSDSRQNLVGQLSIEEWKDRSIELLVGVLGANQLFGEISVLSPAGQAVSPVTVVAYTNIECYVAPRCLLEELGATFDVTMLKALNESIYLYNPHPEKLAHLYGDRRLWEDQKSKVLRGVMPAKWNIAREKLQAKIAADYIQNQEFIDAQGAQNVDLFLKDGNRLRRRAMRLPDRQSAERAILLNAAIAQFEKAVRRDERSIPALYGLAQVRHLLKQERQALFCLDEALEVDPSGKLKRNAPAGTVQNLKCQVLAAMRRYEEALDACQEAMRLDAKNVGYKRTLQALEAALSLEISKTTTTTPEIPTLKKILEKVQYLTGTKKQSKRRGGHLGSATMNYHVSKVRSAYEFNQARQKALAGQEKGPPSQGLHLQLQVPLESDGLLSPIRPSRAGAESSSSTSSSESASDDSEDEE